MRLFLAIITVCLFSSGAFAAVMSSTEPVEISAAKSLEWNRKAKTYTAHENVIVTQGAMNMHSDKLIARYKDESGMTDISTLEAEIDVVIVSPPYTAYGDRAVYDVKTGHAVLTGNDLKIASEDNTLTADQKIEFFSAENKMAAVGNAVVTSQNGDSLSAPTLTAVFAKGPDGAMTANKITGNGGVVIKTEKETITGDTGVYDVQSKKAVLTGKVKVLQGKNWLEGTRADVDMLTGISQLSGNAAGSGGRVKGVFYPATQGQKK